MKKFFTIAITLLFAGALSAQTVVYGEDFESGLPMDWTAENEWMHGTTATLSSQFFGIPDHTSFMAVNDDGLGQGVSGDGLLISPKLDFTDVAAPGMSFEAYFINGDYGADETAKVMVSTDGGTTWTEVYDIDGGDDWQKITVSLLDYAGAPEVWIAFEYTDGGGWNYGYAVDDIEIFQPENQLDIELTEIFDGQRFGNAPFIQPLTGSITNTGATEITSLDLNWTDGTDTYTMSMPDVSIPPFASMEFTHDTEVEVATNSTVRVVDIWVSNINGGDDDDMDNNAASEVFSGLSFEAPVAVVAEEATGTWCGWCPRGHVFMETMEEAYGDEGFIGIAVHGGSTNEPMYVPAYADYNDLISGYPSGTINRQQLDVDPSNFEAAYNNSIGRAVPVQIDLSSSVNPGTGLMTVTVQGTFAAALKGDYRFAVVVTENEVTGTGDGTNTNNLDYDQVNYYSGGGNGVMGGYEALPDPVPATEMVYQDVARAMLGGFNGEEGSLPEFIEQDAVHSHQFFYSLSPNSNEEHMQVIGLLIDAKTGEIMNGFEANVGENTITGLNDISLYENEVTVFPNPFSEVTNLKLDLDEVSEVSLEVFNALGQRVASRAYGELSGEVLLPFNGANLESGMYYMHLNINGKIITKKVMHSK
jgi:hypothetical protein